MPKEYVLWEKPKAPRIRRVVIIPLGKIDQRVASFLDPVLKRVFHAWVDLGDRMEQLDFAQSKAREQYNASLIMKRLNSFKSSTIDKILAIADVDLYESGALYVLGQSDPIQGIALISVTRLRPEFYNRSPSDKTFLSRIHKTAIHELAHAYGLGHCTNPKCIMFPPKDISDEDRKGTELCNKCTAKLIL